MHSVNIFRYHHYHQENRGPLTKPEFLLYLDAEIDSQDYNSPLENMLITTKLRLLDEVGKGMGVDVMVLPKLAAEENPAELRRKVMSIVTLICCDFPETTHSLFPLL